MSSEAVKAEAQNPTELPLLWSVHENQSSQLQLSVCSTHHGTGKVHRLHSNLKQDT